MPAEDRPSFSVLVTASFGPALLRQVLAAIRAQEYAGPVEVIVADSGPGSQSGEVSLLCAEAGATYLRVESCQGFSVAAARNQAMEQCAGAYVLLLDGDTIPPPWHLAGCARALRGGGSYVTLSTRRAGLPRLYTPSAAVEERFFGARPDEGAPAEVQRGENLHACSAGSLAFHRSLIDRGLRFDESMPAAAVDFEFACRLDDAGYRSRWIASWSCLQLPRPHEPFRAKALVAAERALLAKHPHALLQGSCELALEPVSGGMVSIVMNVHDDTPRQLKRALSLTSDQDYPGEIELLVFSRSPLTSASIAVCRQARARLVVGAPDACGDDSFPDPVASLLAAGMLTPEASIAPDPMKLLMPGSPATPGVRNAALPPWQRAICAALPLARGRYLLYLEQGVALTPQHVQSCVNILRCQGDCVVCWGQALPIEQLLLHDTLTPFSRFHLTSERIRQLVRRAGGVERIPVRSLQGGEPSGPDHLFLSREMAQRVTSQDSGAVPLPGSVTLPALIHAGARPVRLEGLQAYRAFSERRRAS